MPCCIATAHDNAADADANTTMSPSPRFFTSVPPASATACRKIEKCSRRNSSAASGARLDASAVEPTMSVNNTATFSVVTSAVLPNAPAHRMPASLGANHRGGGGGGGGGGGDIRSGEHDLVCSIRRGHDCTSRCGVAVVAHQCQQSVRFSGQTVDSVRGNSPAR